MADYATIHQLSQDRDFYARVHVAATVKGIENAEAWTHTNLLKIAMDPGISDAYEYALRESPYHSRPGHDKSIITDEQICAVVEQVHAGEGIS